MEILDFKMYKDGGTTEITTNEGVYCYDHRLTSTTKGALYLGMPKDDNSNIIEDYETIEKELLEGLKSYKNEFYQGQIERLILIKQNTYGKI